MSRHLWIARSLDGGARPIVEIVRVDMAFQVASGWVDRLALRRVNSISALHRRRIHAL